MARVTGIIRHCVIICWFKMRNLSILLLNVHKLTKCHIFSVILPRSFIEKQFFVYKGVSEQLSISKIGLATDTC